MAIEVKFVCGPFVKLDTGEQTSDEDRVKDDSNGIHSSSNIFSRSFIKYLGIIN